MTLLEQKAVKFLENTNVISLSSVSGNGYPRICAMAKLKSEGLSIWVSTGTESKKTDHYKINPKAGVLYYNENDSVTLNGVIEIVSDEAVKKGLWQDWMQKHFPGGADDPNYCVLKFTAKEAIIYIDEEFETFTY